MKLTHAQLHAHKQYEWSVDKTHSVTQLLQHLGHKTEIMNTCDRSVGKTVLRGHIHVCTLKYCI